MSFGFDTFAQCPFSSAPSASSSVAYSLSGSNGSYTYTGQSATLSYTAHYKLSGANGSYSYAGQVATLDYTPGSGSVAYALSGDAGVYSYSGQSATFAWSGENTKTGGDDAFHPNKHTGWNKKTWKRKQQQDSAIEETIRATLQRISGIEPEPEVVQSVIEEVKEEQKTVYHDYTDFSEWLDSQVAIVNQIIAKRQEEDDEEALLLLL